LQISHTDKCLARVCKKGGLLGKYFLVSVGTLSVLEQSLNTTFPTEWQGGQGGRLVPQAIR